MFFQSVHTSFFMPFTFGALTVSFFNSQPLYGLYRLSTWHKRKAVIKTAKGHLILCRQGIADVKTYILNSWFSVIEVLQQIVETYKNRNIWQ